MRSLLRTTTAGAALATALNLSPQALLAQDAVMDETPAAGARAPADDTAAVGTVPWPSKVRRC